MEQLNEILLSEVEGFRKAGHKFLNGEITRAEFKGISGGMGVYAHRSGKEFMIRFRTPSGIASIDELKFLYDFANKFNLESIHFTTRQAVQLHGISIDEACDCMIEGINNNFYTRGSGGNFPRNVALSPLSGVEVGEVFDVSPYALAVNKHFMKKINSYKLPRKFKVAFSSSDTDESHATVADLGFMAVLVDGEKYFKVYIGGGLGRSPRASIPLEGLIKAEDILFHVEAITDLFINEGDYENKSRARIRYIVERMGEDQFVKCYEGYLEKSLSKENLKVKVESKVYNKKGSNTSMKNPRLISQNKEGLYSVYVHPTGGILKLENFKEILDFIEALEDVELRLSMSEGFYIRNLNGEEAEKVISMTNSYSGENALQYSVACIGVPICQMGVLESQKTLNDVINYFKEKNFTKDILPSIHISGCPNSCGVHEIGQIGFCGKKKRVKDKLIDAFELHLGGAIGIEKTRLGKYYGDLKAEEVPEFLYKLALEIEKSGKSFDDFIVQKDDILNKILEKYLICS